MLFFFSFLSVMTNPGEKSLIKIAYLPERGQFPSEVRSGKKKAFLDNPPNSP